MTINEYVRHYTTTSEAVIFLLLTCALLLVTVCVLFLYSRMCMSKNAENREVRIREHFEELSEEFYELVFAGGSILLFMASFYLINRFFDIQPYRGIWDEYKDFLLLLLIVLSIAISRIVDNVFIRLKRITHTDKAAIRLISMLYMILIFCYIKFIYEDNNYDSFISYFLGLMIGRFVYFDASIKDFWTAIKVAVTKLPLMIVALVCTSVLSLYGFKTGFLIKHIGVVTNVFFIHVYMTIAIFLFYHTYELISRKHRS